MEVIKQLLKDKLSFCALIVLVLISVVIIYGAMKLGVIGKKESEHDVNQNTK